jgi:hypothetical protein
MPDSSSSLGELLDRSSEDLLRLLGEEGRRQAGPLDYLSRGREIYNNLRQRLRQTICTSEKLYDLWAKHKAGNRELIVAGIVDCIGGALAGVSPAVVAVLIYKDGLPSYCEEEWSATFAYRADGN